MIRIPYLFLLEQGVGGVVNTKLKKSQNLVCENME